MIIDTLTWLYILLVLGVIVLLYSLKRMYKVRVWIKASPKPGAQMIEMGYLELSGDGTAGEVHLPGGGTKAPLARVIADEQSNREVGFVEIVTTDIEDETEKPHYRQCGYINYDMSIDEGGYIYKHIKGQRKKELIGYCARPSAPNTPTLHGERSWKTLWLVCTLNAYWGKPQTTEKKNEKEEKDTKKKDEKIEKIMGIAGDAGTTEEDKTQEGPTTSQIPESSEIQENSREASIPDEVDVLEKEDTSSDITDETKANDVPETEDTLEEAAAPQPEEEPTGTDTPPIVEEWSEEEKKELDAIKAQSAALLKKLVANMVHVEGGQFVMGADQNTDAVTTEDNKGAVELNESPKHNVTVSDYYIGKYPVTQAEWKAVMGNNPSESQDSENYPVAPVTWKDCQTFLKRLSYLTGTTFVLPTEAQWEYAARGGNKSQGYIFSGSNDFAEVGHKDYRHEVGTKKPNELGLYDMSGLVREWCSDLWGHYTADDQTDPTGPTEDSPQIVKDTEDNFMRAVRSPAGNETVTNRKGENPELIKDFKSYGFRLVCQTLPEGTENTEESEDTTVLPQEMEKKDIQKKGKENRLAAVCRYTSFRSSKRDYLPAEARACAYALLARSFQRRKYSEYYKDHPYGWRDTALLTTLIYSLLFLLLYIFNTGVLQMPLLGNDLLAVGILIAAYYLLWALVRFIKIDCIENSNSFQPKLDLLNKNLGLGFMNWATVVLALIAFYFTYEYYDYDLLPLIWAIGFGVMINMTLKGANRPWRISSSYNDADIEDEDEEEEAEKVENPPGDITRTYEWDLDSCYSCRQLHGSLSLYFTATEMTDMRHCNPFFAQRKDKNDKEYILEMFHFLKEHRPFLARTRYIAHYISTTIDKQNLLPLDKIQFTLDFIQEPNIQFVNNRDCKNINHYEDYIRYPDETLYDKEAECNSKSLLAAMLFHVMGYNVLYLASRRFQHAGVAIEVRPKDLAEGWYGGKHKVNEITIDYNGKHYIYCETTGDSFRIGDTLDGMKLEDFEEIVPLPVTEDADEENHEEEDDNVVSRIYNWDLDSELGNKLHGNITLDFSVKEMEELRDLNPFRTYGNDSNTYQTNINSIFDYLFKDSDRTSRVRTIADYIRESIHKAGYPELDLVQFALDFAQAPNITYCVDENSASIEYAKEYMRFPDEVLYDKEGDCDCKSSLTAALFHELGYNVIFMLSQKLKHAAIGIECKEEWLQNINPENPDSVLREYNGKRYLYCETTGDGNKIGHIKENDSIQDFETIIEVPV